MKARSLSVAVALGLLVASSGASALAPTEATALIPFNFSNPGARSLAMGGAFTGSADDATAALVNPAGLTRLGLDQQLSVEYRNNSRDVPYVAGGTGNFPTDFSGVDYRDSGADTDEISYIAWVLPQDSWALSLYRHQMVNFEGGHRSERVNFANDPIGTGLRAVQSATDLEVVTYGAAFAWNATDAISIGGGLTWNDFEMRSDLARFDAVEDGSEVLALSQRARGDDDDIGYNIGLLYKGSDAVSFGLSYRSAPEFRYSYVADFTDFINGGVIRGADATTPFKSPDVLSFGLSWRATDSLMVNLDVNRVGYSNITERIDNPFFTGENATLADPEFNRSIVIDDVIEPRIGVEYAIDATYPMFIRGGLWHEKQHTLSYRGTPDNPLDFINSDGSFNSEADENAYIRATEQVATALLYSTGDDQTHVSVGFGVSFPNFQVDFAYDRSEKLDVLSLSGVYRF